MNTRNHFFFNSVLVGALINPCNAHCMPLKKNKKIVCGDTVKQGHV